MKKIFKLTLILLTMIMFFANLKAEQCPFILKTSVEFWLCPDGTYNWDETTKTLNTSIEKISYIGSSSNRPPFSVLLEAVVEELLKDTKIHCRSEYPACDDPNVPKVYEQKISFPACWYYENSQPFVGDDYILSIVKCEGSRCVSTYEVCTDYSTFPYTITHNLVTKIIEGIPCTAIEPTLPPESNPVWQQNWTTPCFILNNCN